MEKRKTPQLYGCIESLSSKVRDESSLGLLVGYTLARSLIGFDPAQYGREPRSFKEIWEIYDGLSEISAALNSEQVHSLVAKLKEEVNTRLKQCITDPDKTNKETDLLRLLVGAAKRKNMPLEQFLKEVGSRVSRSTLERGFSSEAINRIYTEDYKLLERTISV